MLTPNNVGTGVAALTPTNGASPVPMLPLIDHP